MKSAFAHLIGFYTALMLAAPVSASFTASRAVLDNGIVLLTSEQKNLPIVSVELLLDAGSRYDPPDRQGLANLTAELLTDGTRKRSAVQISEALDFMGANLSIQCGNDFTSISMTLLKKDLPAGLELLADILTAAVFPAEEIERQKQSVLAMIKAREENPGEIAQRKFAELLFPSSPYGRPPEGTEKTVKSVEQDDLKEFYSRHYRPNRAIMAVVGDVSQSEITEAIGRAFESWRKGAPPSAPPRPAEVGSARTTRIQKDLTQANIVMGHAGVARSNPDYYAIQVMNYILGGGDLSSRLMESIRNQRGLAYSVYSYFGAEKSHGVFEVVMQTKNDTAPEAIRIVREEIRRIRQQPVSEEALNDAKDYLTGSFPLRFDTNRKVAAFLAQVEYFGLGLDYPDRYPELIRAIGIADVQQAAAEYLHPDQMIVVVVGALEKIGEK
jgi:zinc protease